MLFQLKQLSLLEFIYRIGSTFFQTSSLVVDHCPFKVDLIFKSQINSFEAKTEWMTSLHDHFN